MLNPRKRSRTKEHIRFAETPVYYSDLPPQGGKKKLKIDFHIDHASFPDVREANLKNHYLESVQAPSTLDFTQQSQEHMAMDEPLAEESEINLSYYGDIYDGEEEEEEEESEEIEENFVASRELGENESIVHIKIASCFAVLNAVISYRSGENLIDFWLNQSLFKIHHFSLLRISQSNISSLPSVLSTFRLSHSSNSQQFHRLSDALEFNAVSAVSIFDMYLVLIKSESGELVVEMYRYEEKIMKELANVLVQSAVWIDFLVSRTEARIVSSMKLNIAGNGYYILDSSLSSLSQIDDDAETIKIRQQDIHDVSQILDFFGGHRLTDPTNESCKYFLVHKTDIHQLLIFSDLIQVKSRDSIKFVTFGAPNPEDMEDGSIDLGFFLELFPPKRGVISLEPSLLYSHDSQPHLTKVLQFIEKKNSQIIHPDDPPRWRILLNEPMYSRLKQILKLTIREQFLTNRSGSSSQGERIDADVEHDAQGDNEASQTEIHIAWLNLFTENEFQSLSDIDVISPNNFVSLIQLQPLFMTQYRHFIYITDTDTTINEMPDNNETVAGVHTVRPDEFLCLYGSEGDKGN